MLSNVSAIKWPGLSIMLLTSREAIRCLCHAIRYLGFRKCDAKTPQCAETLRQVATEHYNVGHVEWR